MARHLPITSPDAPPAVGPYNPGVRIDNFIFISGQLPIDIKTKKLAGADIASQTRQAMQNIQSLLEVTGATMGQIVKTTVYLKNMEDFKEMNRVYAEFFKIEPPARSCVEVARLPYNCLIEIEAIAYHEREPSGLEKSGF
jgi:2-iminobutanoate/2-iminopropanoate deaminase